MKQMQRTAGHAHTKSAYFWPALLFSEAYE